MTTAEAAAVGRRRRTVLPPTARYPQSCQRPSDRLGRADGRVLAGGLFMSLRSRNNHDLSRVTGGILRLLTCLTWPHILAANQ